MSHPRSKREFLVVGKRKGYKRVRQWFGAGNSFSNAQRTIEDVFKLREKFARVHRNTTKICGRRCCANPRKHEKELTLQERKFAEEQTLLDFKNEGMNDEQQDISISRKNTN